MTHGDAAPVQLLSDEDAIKRLEEIKVSHPSNRCAKYFTREYYNSLSEENRKALIACCRSGTYNPDSSVGCYAMRPEDYDTLKGFFGPLISDYHGTEPGAVQVTDWNAGKMDLGELGLGASSSRVRVGRNLSAFPLPGAMTQQQRVDMESVMCAAYLKLATMTMPDGKTLYGGRYYSLTPGRPESIDEAQYQKLIDEHLMFKSMDKDPYLRTAGISADWPHGRGAYISDDRRVSIWCNEEDHLRVTCLCTTAMLNEPFDLLAHTLKQLESIENVVFARSNEYGYVTSCPSNLGTGMRASVHVRFPNLTADGTTDKASAIGKKFGMSVRGTGGEHTPVVNNTVDLSPSARFGIPEATVLKMLHAGIKAMMAEENKLGAPLSDEEAVKRLEEIKVSHPSNRCAKYFTREYYNSLSEENRKALLACCRSGTYNPDSSVGCYAMRPEDYDTLKGFFGPLICDYHGTEPGAVQVTDWNAGKMDLGELGLGASSSRVRVGRNLSAFPLPGAMTQQQRVDMESVMRAAYLKLATMTMPDGKTLYGGRYYSLTPNCPESIDEAQYQKLIDEHLMFKSMDKDPYLRTAGISGDWPYGRGAYISNDRRVSIWCNEEDHLRVTCLCTTAMLNEPFDLLAHTLKQLESIENVVFARSNEYGYVTSCPSNLGTGMRASVHVRFPNLTADGTTDKASAIGKKFGMSVRGTGGEHTPVVNNTVDLSPSARFGIPEAKVLKMLHDGIKAMMVEENNMGSAVLSDEDAVKRLEEIKVSHPKNRCAKYFTREYYNSLSEENRKALLACCRSGTYNPDSSVGCYAMRPEDYDTLKGFFGPLICDYHGTEPGAVQVTDWNAGKMDLGELGLGASSSRVRVGRNLSAFPLPGAMTQQQRVDMESVMRAAYLKLATMTMPDGKTLYGGRYYSLTPNCPESINDAEYQKLIDEHLMFKSMDKDPYLRTAGISADWPHGRGAYISNDRRVSIWCNEEDHLRVTCLCTTAMLNEPFDLLAHTLKQLESIENVVFARSNEYGYVTSCPSNLGTGMRASVHVRFPNLTADGTTDKASEVGKKFGMSVRGTGGEHTPVVNNTVDLSPSARFGIPEATVLKMLHAGIKAMMVEENKLAGTITHKEGEQQLDQLREDFNHPRNRCGVC